jgi:ATP-dependent DNA helicase RecQ
MRIVKMVQDSNANEQHKRAERNKIESLLGWCETNTCRRRALLRYFGEQREEVCGNCDICLNPPRTWDATEDAQKLLSNIYRTGQRFGSGHVIDVLRGKETAKVNQFGHQALSTYGIGAQRTDKQWRSIIRQLLVQNFLLVNDEMYGAIQLTEKARQILKGETKIFLREELSAVKSVRERRRPAEVSEQDQDLWEALKAKRKELADELGLPPFHIFHDATLMEMMQIMPTNDADLLSVNGVGAVKLEKFGEHFLSVITEFN